MRSNWWRWLWGIIPILILGWVAVEAEHSRLEKDLSDRSVAALNGAGLGWASVTYQGRDGILTGRATEVGDPDKAVSEVYKVWGVRVVENRADIIEKIDNYVWSASRGRNRVRLSGYVPNASARQLILGMARANFPGFEIQDRMKLARGVPALDPWLGAVSFGLKQLTLLRSGEARLENMNLVVAGEAEDATAYRTLRSQLSSGLPKTIKLVGSGVQPPVVSPHVWSAKFDGASMAFKGSVPSDTDQAAILAAARDMLGDKAITDDAEPGAGTPQGWGQAAVLAVRQLRKLEHGTIEIRDGVLTLAGLAPDEAAAGAIRSAFAGMPATIKVVDSVQIKPPPKAPEPPAPVVEPPAPPPVEKEARAPEPSPQPKPAPVAVEPKVEAPKAETRVESKPEAKPEPKPEVKAEPKAPPPAPERKVEAAPPTPPPAVKPPPPPPPATPQMRAAMACEDNLRTLAAAGTILFRYGSAEITPESTETLTKLAEAAKGCPDMIISIGGYASAEGSLPANIRLSDGRARSVLAYLVKAGVDAKQLEAKGYGIERPVAPNTTFENMAKNRRIEFSVRPMAGVAR